MLPAAYLLRYDGYNHRLRVLSYEAGIHLADGKKYLMIDGADLLKFFRESAPESDKRIIQKLESLLACIGDKR